MRFRLSSFLTILLISSVGVTAPQSDDSLPLRRVEGDRTQMLVLQNGRVIRGELVPRQDGYDVISPGGRLFLGSEQIRFLAADIDDAYERLRETLPDLTPENHLLLAKWCLTNNLKAKAKREVLDALHLDPYRQDARQMLENLVREERQSTNLSTSRTATNANFEKSSRPANTAVANSEMAPERRSLGGLPKSLAQEFTQSIQPLVVNKCGNARCHGSRENSFSVVSFRNGSTTAIAEQNLASILNQINPNDPEHSPLLTATIGLHGGSSQLLFSGQAGGRQANLLRQWVLDAAREIGPRTVAFHTPPDGDEPAGSATNTTPATMPTSTAIPGTKRSTNETDTTYLTDAVAATRKDEFNPNIFNRKFHATEFRTGSADTANVTTPTNQN